MARAFRGGVIMEVEAGGGGRILLMLILTITLPMSAVDISTDYGLDENADSKQSPTAPTGFTVPPPWNWSGDSNPPSSLTRPI